MKVHGNRQGYAVQSNANLSEVLRTRFRGGAAALQRSTPDRFLNVMPQRTRRVATFDILLGLPTYGDRPEAFTATGQGRHREGYVVRFHPDGSASWVGNFQPGLSSFDTVLQHPNGRHFLVISGGQGYVVDPEDQAQREYFGTQIEVALHVPELDSVVFGNGLWFELLGPGDCQWRSGRISWDGMRMLRREELRLFGEAWSPLEDCWLPFELDLCTGEFIGGSYNGPNAGA